METIIRIILSVLCILFGFYMILSYHKKNNKIIENIKSRGHFVIDENDEGEKKVYFISENGVKTRYYPRTGISADTFRQCIYMLNNTCYEDGTGVTEEDIDYTIKQNKLL